MTINYNKWSAMPEQERMNIFNRSELVISDVMDTVSQIIDNVKSNGDKALYEYNRDFDGVKPEKYNLRVSAEEFEEAESSLSADVKEAIDFSIANVLKFHKSQIPEGMNMIEIRKGVFAGEKAIAIESAGLYVPRGRGSFPSMLYMQAIPAIAAGVRRICIVTPPDEMGKVDPGCLYAARKCGVSEVYKTGGAQAIAALAYGTESIKPVVKITGPGSKYVSAAKRLLSGIVDPGLPAGPSDSAVLADASADPYKAALDLMTEAEHGSDSSAILVTDSESLARKCMAYLDTLAAKLPPQRKKFVEDVFAGFGGIILVDSIEEGARVVNIYAPEHLQIVTEDPWDTVQLIENAGEILLGDNTPFSNANYSIGANAVLPTGGKAKTWSALSARDFIKYSSIVYSTAKGYRDLEKHVKVLADYEGFAAHGNALKLRNDNV
ncbi:histidinol dehydrogenase [Spirochaeta isovalerica]|uniref:Histidinol dehydrogenase n=1 Tax=Spirochaeta isovalerica TaxID=150 RepID=A0A841R462_9SPIO|nr:histidinol dehydrogenase [Spirochaeta isovalerica]MBB6478606.1 histidinol dehydrogenase [Spirochaeta isovalerica]